MKTWKILIVASLAVVAVALITSTAFAYYTGGQGAYGRYGSYGPTTQGSGGSMMGGPMGGGMMGGGGPTYGPYGGYQYPNGYPQNSGSWTGGYGGCH